MAGGTRLGATAVWLATPAVAFDQTSGAKIAKSRELPLQMIATSLERGERIR
jgi:hypothetical protein